MCPLNPEFYPLNTNAHPLNPKIYHIIQIYVHLNQRYVHLILNYVHLIQSHLIQPLTFSPLESLRFSRFRFRSTLWRLADPPGGAICLGATGWTGRAGLSVNRRRFSQRFSHIFLTSSIRWMTSETKPWKDIIIDEEPALLGTLPQMNV